MLLLTIKSNFKCVSFALIMKLSDENEILELCTPDNLTDNGNQKIKNKQQIIREIFWHDNVKNMRSNK